LANKRLAELKEQRDDLDQTIRELEAQIEWGAEFMRSKNIPPSL